jgi:hypothetical protein
MSGVENSMRPGGGTAEKRTTQPIEKRRKSKKIHD